MWRVRRREVADGGQRGVLTGASLGVARRRAGAGLHNAIAVSQCLHGLIRNGGREGRSHYRAGRDGRSQKAGRSGGVVDNVWFVLRTDQGRRNENKKKP